MITYRTFVKQFDGSKELVAQQNDLRNELQIFINNVVGPENILQINEQMLTQSNQFVLTAWYTLPVADTESEFDMLPEAQSADVLAQSLREKGRPDRVNIMVDEHIIRSDSS